MVCSMDDSLSLIAVHGEHSGFAHNIASDPNVRVKRRGKWRTGIAKFVAADDSTISQFGLYARSGLRAFGADPMILRITLD